METKGDAEARAQGPLCFKYGRVPPFVSLPMVRSSSSNAFVAFALTVLAVCAACRSSPSRPRENRQGTLEDLTEMVTAGAEPVHAERDELSLGTPEEEGEAVVAGSFDETAAVDERVMAEALAEGGRVDRAEEADPVAPERRENPYLAFGGRIIVHDDGRVTKPYPLPPKRGRRMLDLMLMMSKQGFMPVQEVQFDSPGDPDTTVVKAVLLENWDAELYQNLRQFPPKDLDVPMADWLVCTASQELMDDVEYFMALFATGIPQVEIEAKIVELTETNVLDYGVRPQVNTAGDLIPTAQLPGTGLIDDILLNFPNAESANEAILSLGAVQDGVAVTAIFEAMASWDNVSIISQPKIAVREGGRAEILNTEELPFFNVKSISDTGTFNATLDFKEVGVKLYIVPRVIATDTFALHIDIEASQEAGTLTTVVAEQAGGLQTPIIAKRSVNTVVYLKEGQVLILGGLTTERQREQERKVPILGDIPLLGWLFKSKFTQTTRTHVLFFIRPRILEGSDFNREF